MAAIMIKNIIYDEGQEGLPTLASFILSLDSYYNTDGELDLLSLETELAFKLYLKTRVLVETFQYIIFTGSQIYAGYASRKVLN